MTYDEGFAAGMRRAAELCDQLIEASPKSRGVGYWRVIKSMILAAIPTPAPWTPPEDRPDGYRCLAWDDFGWRVIIWDDEGWWFAETGRRLQWSPRHFMPYPPTPEDAP